MTKEPVHSYGFGGLNILSSYGIMFPDVFSLGAFGAAEKEKTHETKRMKGRIEQTILFEEGTARKAQRSSFEFRKGSPVYPQWEEGFTARVGE